MTSTVGGPRGVFSTSSRDKEARAVARLDRRPSISMGDDDDGDELLNYRNQMSPFSLHFSRSLLFEQKFQKYYRHKYVESVRKALLYGTIIFALFAANDGYKYSYDERSNIGATLAIRAAAVVVGVLCILATYFLPRFEAAMNPVVACAILAVGSAQLVFGVIESNTLDPTYSGIVLLVGSIGYSFFRLRFIFAITITWTLFAEFVLLTILTHSYDTSAHHKQLGIAIVLLGIGCTIDTWFAYWREFFIRKGFLMNLNLKREERNHNRLLLRMLPEEIIRKLKKGVKFFYSKHADISILFSNIYDFDSVASRLDAHSLVTLLNVLFSRFDAITDELNVYKVETIGDVYMVCAGCPQAVENHAELLADLALDMTLAVRKLQMKKNNKAGAGKGNTNNKTALAIALNAAAAQATANWTDKERAEKEKADRELNESKAEAAVMSVSQATANGVKPPATADGARKPSNAGAGGAGGESTESDEIQIRIGINSGGVIAGVIGMTYPRYRLMGDTVNTASRMATTVDAGKIQLSASTYSHLSSKKFKLSPRGEIPVKGKGAMKVYYLDGRVGTGTKHSRINTVVLAQQSEEKALVDDTMRGLLKTKLASTTNLAAVAGAGGVLPSASVGGGGPPSALGGGPPSALLVNGSTPGAAARRASVGNRERSLMKPERSVSRAPTPQPTVGPAPTPPPPASGGGGSARPPSPNLLTVPNGTNAASTSTPVRAIDAREAGKTDSPAKSDAPAAPRPITPPVRATSNTLHLPKHIHASALNVRTNSPGSSGGGGNSSGGGASGGASGAAAAGGTPNSAEAHKSELPGATTTPQRPPSSVHRNTIILPAPPILSSQLHQHGSMSALGVPPSTIGTGSREAHQLKQLWASRAAAAAAAAAAANDPNHKQPPSPPAALSPLQIPDPASGAAGVSGATATLSPLIRTGTKRTLAEAEMDVQPLFSIPDVEDLMHPHSLRFQGRTGLEESFLDDYYTRFLIPNRNGIFWIGVFFLLLGVWDTIEFHDDTTVLITIWVLRGVGVACLLALYLFTYSASYNQWMQHATAITLGFVGCLLVTINIVMNTWLQLYGVGCLTIWLSVSAMSVGLRYLYSMSMSFSVLVWFCVAGLIFKTQFPLVIFFLLVGNVMYTYSAYSSELYVRQDFVRLRKREEEEATSAGLLTSMLPEVIVHEIRHDITLIAKDFNSASVLFCDIVQFTKLASSISAEELVMLLNVVFSTFDALTEKYNVYKVETIGDCYFACSGIVNQFENHTHNLVDFALEMEQATAEFDVTANADRDRIRVRVGIHTGHVVAGVVGKKMPRYHLFGETITIAEAVEAKGETSAVCVSGTTKQALGTFFVCEPKGLIEVGGRKIEKWLVIGRSGSERVTTFYGTPVVGGSSLEQQTRPLPSAGSGAAAPSAGGAPLSPLTEHKGLPSPAIAETLPRPGAPIGLFASALDRAERQARHQAAQAAKSASPPQPKPHALQTQPPAIALAAPTAAGATTAPSPTAAGARTVTESTRAAIDVGGSQRAPDSGATAPAAADPNLIQPLQVATSVNGSTAIAHPFSIDSMNSAERKR